MAGGVITFIAPSIGASAALSSLSAAIDLNGVASISATANSTAGNYAVTASAIGVTAPTSFSLTNQLPLTITSIAAVSPNPRDTAVSSIDVTFSEPINTSSLSSAALTLTDDGGANLINGGVTIACSTRATLTRSTACRA